VNDIKLLIFIVQKNHLTRQPRHTIRKGLFLRFDDFESIVFSKDKKFSPAKFLLEKELERVKETSHALI
jgi:hypothetical protein